MPLQATGLHLNVQDLTGWVFDRLTVLCHAGSDSHRYARWLCRCSCGVDVTVRGSHLVSRQTKSCGNCGIRKRPCKLTESEYREERKATLLAGANCDGHGCWMWRKARPGDYGAFRLFGRNRPSNVAAYILMVGDVPDGMYVCHRCDTPGCINPSHLFVGTHLDNIADKCAKGRQARGESAGLSKLTESQVIEIRSRHERLQATVASLAEEFGVSSATIYCIVTRKTWKHI